MLDLGVWGVVTITYTVTMQVGEGKKRIAVVSLYFDVLRNGSQIPSVHVFMILMSVF